MKQLFFIFYFFLPLILCHADELPFKTGEELKFDIHYKYGLVMLKAGTANYKVVSSVYNGNNSYFSTLDFKTTSFFDKIYRMRDTLHSHLTENMRPLYHIRMIREGNYNFAEEVFTNQFGKDFTEVRVRRQAQQSVRLDTILSVNAIGYDLLNLIQYLRSIDYSQSEFSTVGTVFTFIGREKIPVTIRNEGKSIVEKSESLKYTTYKISLDFTDKVFNESRSAIEIWISDDKNRIPIKIRAKLKIGAAEVYLTSWKNLKYPFSSEVKIPNRR